MWKSKLVTVPGRRRIEDHDGEVAGFFVGLGRGARSRASLSRPISAAFPDLIDASTVTRVARVEN